MGNVASVVAGDIDIVGGRTGTGLGDELGVTGSSVSCQKRTILKAISIFQSAWKSEK